MTCTLGHWCVELHNGTFFKRGFKQIATATSTAAVGSKKAHKWSWRSAHAWNPKREAAAYNLSINMIRLFCYFFKSLVLKPIIVCFSLWFPSKYVFPAFSQQRKQMSEKPRSHYLGADGDVLSPGLRIHDHRDKQVISQSNLFVLDNKMNNFLY